MNGSLSTQAPSTSTSPMKTPSAFETGVSSSRRCLRPARRPHQSSPRERAVAIAPMVLGSDDIGARYAARTAEGKRADKLPPRLRPWGFVPTFAAWPDSTTRR